MNLTPKEKQIVCNLLSQISVPVNQAPVVLRIIEKLQLPPASVDSKEETKVE